MRNLELLLSSRIRGRPIVAQRGRRRRSKAEHAAPARYKRSGAGACCSEIEIEIGEIEKDCARRHGQATVQVEQRAARSQRGRKSGGHLSRRYRRVGLPGQDGTRVETDRVGSARGFFPVRGLAIVRAPRPVLSYIFRAFSESLKERKTQSSVYARLNIHVYIGRVFNLQ